MQNKGKKRGELEKTIAILERTLEVKNIEGQLREQLLDVLKSKKEQYEKITDYRTKGAILRSQSRWYNEGDKNTKYFLNLEKIHNKQRTRSQLGMKNDNFIIRLAPPAGMMTRIARCNWLPERER